MRDRAAHEHRMQHARQLEIGDEVPAAGQQPMILAAQDGATDERRFLTIVHAGNVMRTRLEPFPGIAGLGKPEARRNPSSRKQMALRVKPQRCQHCSFGYHIDVFARYCCAGAIDRETDAATCPGNAAQSCRQLPGRDRDPGRRGPGAGRARQVARLVRDLAPQLKHDALMLRRTFSNLTRELRRGLAKREDVNPISRACSNSRQEVHRSATEERAEHDAAVVDAGSVPPSAKAMKAAPRPAPVAAHSG